MEICLILVARIHENARNFDCWFLLSSGRTVGWLEVVSGGVELPSELRAGVVNPTLEVSTRVPEATGLQPEVAKQTMTVPSWLVTQKATQCIRRLLLPRQTYFAVAGPLLTVFSVGWMTDPPLFQGSTKYFLSGI